MELRDNAGGITWPTALFFLSGSVVLYEILLTRIFSVVFNYHFSFAVLSLVMFGFGVGGLVLRHGLRGCREIGHSIVLFIFFAVGAVILISLVGIFTEIIPRWIGLLIFTVLGVVPFIASGFAVSSFFSRWSGRSEVLYASDMSGAATGALLSIVVLDWLGPVKGTLVVGVLASVSLVLVAIGLRGRVLYRNHAYALIALFAVHIATAFLFQGDVPVMLDPSKDILRAASAERGWDIIERRWSSFGRTDLVKRHGQEGYLELYVDGAAGTVMYDISKITDDNHPILSFSGLVPLLYLSDEQKDSSLIIGAGGGQDVLANLITGLRSITAVEVNPDLVQIVRDFSDYNGGIYSSMERVEVVVGEGRRFVRQSQTLYDIIMLTLPITKSSRSIEGYALTENSLFTVEAIGDYLKHLTDEGQLIIVAHHAPELMRLVSLTLETQRREGITISDGLRHIYTVGFANMPVLIVSKQPINEEEAAVRYLDQIYRGSEPGSFYVPYLPEGLISKDSPVYPLWQMENGQETLLEFIQRAPFDISPVTDNSPFFYSFSKGIFKDLPAPIWVFLLVVLILIVYFFKQDFSTAINKNLFTGGALMFAAIGAGYMLVEISIFQRLMFVFKNPAHSAGMLLFSLLVGSGLGGVLARSKFFGHRLDIRYALAVVAGLIPVLALLFEWIAGLPVHSGILSVGTLIFTGVILGLPVPCALRRIHALNTAGASLPIPFFWAMNNIFSVIGAILAIIFGVTIGFRAAFFAGSFIYLAAIIFSLPLITFRIRRKPELLEYRV